MERTGNKRLKIRRTVIIICLAILAVPVALLVYQLTVSQHSDKSPEAFSDKNAAEEDASPAPLIQAEQTEEVQLGQGLVLTQTGTYAGMYMEDGTDDIVQNAWMVVLQNDSQKTLQYAEIHVTHPEGTAKFSISTLPRGASAVLLEQERKSCPDAIQDVKYELMHVVFFQEEPILWEELFKVEGLEGALNIENISGQAIAGDVCIYYKRKDADHYYGGITYLARIEGGMEPGDIKQVMTHHYSPGSCEIMMIDYQRDVPE